MLTKCFIIHYNIKCFMITFQGTTEEQFYLSNLPPLGLTSAKNLGLMVTSKLSWSTQMESKIRKANTVFIFNKRNTSAFQMRVRLYLCTLCCCHFCHLLVAASVIPEPIYNYWKSSRKVLFSPQMVMLRPSFDSQKASLKMQHSTSVYVLPTKEPVFPVKVLTRNALHGGRLEYYNDNN